MALPLDGAITPFDDYPSPYLLRGTSPTSWADHRLVPIQIELTPQKCGLQMNPQAEWFGRDHDRSPLSDVGHVLAMGLFSIDRGEAETGTIAVAYSSKIIAARLPLPKFLHESSSELPRLSAAGSRTIWKLKWLLVPRQPKRWAGISPYCTTNRFRQTKGGLSLMAAIQQHDIF